MATLELKNITKVFDGTVAVHDLSLRVNDGEFLVFVGPSGCGKSTTLRMIAGLETITSGELRIDDRVVNNTPPKDRDIAMVFQNYALYPHMTVYENMSFGLRLRRIDKDVIRKKVQAAAEILGIQGLLDRKPKALSGGQRQRVAMGRAIVREPKVFLFDEPLSNLDARMRVQMRVELKLLQKRLGTTTIYVTHDQVEAMTLANRIAVMNGGKLQQLATPQEVYERPANRFVAQFIGSPSMNFIDGIYGDGLVKAGPLDLPAALNIQNGSNVTIGIRPEHVEVAGADSGNIQVHVDVIENLGSERFAYCSSAVGTLIVRLPGKDISEGSDIDLYIRPERCHVFDEKGNAIGVQQ